ncbi:uncharacterized protein LOC142652532, partial [Rhinoderma darwinii]|uniref:uncharacterized protein LOC142652532 n=1 Tax=Rhinoderma darwinii TaxID=43563 RepID=UPI003F67EE94
AILSAASSREEEVASGCWCFGDNGDYCSRLEQKKYLKTNNPQSLHEFVEDPRREGSLIGLQYVVDIKMLDSDKSVVKCNLCNVKGQMATMKEHLVGANHIKVYMEKHYFSVFQSLKRSCHHKTQLVKLLKDYAKEIERAEGTRGIKMECVSAADMKKAQDNWITEQEERLEYDLEQKKFQVLDKRQMALNYSEKFKISSREEATIVLNLTQQLSDQLEKYFLKYKTLDVLDSTMSDSTFTNSTPAPSDYSPNINENIHSKSAANQGLKIAAKKMQWHPQEPSSSMSTQTKVHLFDGMPVKRSDNMGGGRKPRVSEDFSHQSDAIPESSSECQRRKKRKHKELDNFSTMHSSFSYMNDVGSPRPSSSEVSSSHSYPNYYTFSIPNKKSNVPETFGGEMQMVKDTPQNSVSQNDNSSKIEAVQEIESTNDRDIEEMSDVGAEKNTVVSGPSSSTSNSSNEPTSEKPSSSHTHGKTSKTLSPDILHLLKGKDANTVTNILRTLSPFYPALQEVNLEILGQVLVNTGALD